MSHILVSMIGTHEDLDWIYENQTTDSSSESAAEQAFGYDYLSENEVPFYPTKQEYEEWKHKYDTKGHRTYWDEDSNRANYTNKDNNLILWKEARWDEYPLFTKKDEAAWEVLSNGNGDILDLRPRKNWINVEWDYKKMRNKSHEEIVEYIKNLPDDVTFFFGDAHL